MNGHGSTIYIAGKMSGLYGMGFHIFDRAEHDLREKGWNPINPAQMDREIGFDPYRDADKVDAAFLQAAMERDLDAILHRAEAMAMLPGWDDSTGAKAEKQVAHWKHIPVYQWPEMTELLPDRPKADKQTGLPASAEERKQRPIASGVLDYFPDAIAAVAHCSWVGSQQHNPGKPMCWDKTKSKDHADCLIRHFMQRGTADSDGILHSVKAAWRSLALAQEEIEKGHNA